MQWLLSRLCVRLSRPVTGPGSLHHHRGQADVAIDLQAGNLFDGSDAMLIGVCLHPVGHNPEGVTLTTDSHLKEKKGAFRNQSTNLSQCLF